MNLIIAGASGSSVAIAAITTIATESSVQLFTPLAHLVHKKSYEAKEVSSPRINNPNIDKLSSRIAPHAYQLINYFARPIDGIIQAIVAPFFQIVRYVSHLNHLSQKIDRLKNSLHEENAPLLEDRSHLKNSFEGLPPSLRKKSLSKARIEFYARVSLAFIGIPLYFAIGAINSVGLVIKSAIQLAIPVQAVMSVCLGEKAAGRYFLARKHILQNHPKALNFLQNPNLVKMISPTKGNIHSCNYFLYV